MKAASEQEQITSALTTSEERNFPTSLVSTQDFISWPANENWAVAKNQDGKSIINKHFAYANNEFIRRMTTTAAKTQDGKSIIDKHFAYANN
jgi:hypothetical protein